MTSPYLKRPIRSLEQALRDRARARATVEVQISRALAGGSQLPVPFMTYALPCVIASPALSARPTRHTAVDREAA